jgi:hypothetical protein
MRLKIEADRCSKGKLGEFLCSKYDNEEYEKKERKRLRRNSPDSNIVFLRSQGFVGCRT